MGFIRQSFKRQIFVVFLSVTLLLVICGGILTLQGFQARVKQDYEKRDREQERIIGEKILSMISLSEAALDGIEADEILVDSLTPGRKNTIEIYASLYDKTKDIRGFSTIDMYMGENCMYSTRSGYKSDPCPWNTRFLRMPTPKTVRPPTALTRAMPRRPERPLFLPGK